MEDQDIDLDELDAAYEQDLDKEDTQSDAKAQDAQQNLQQQLQSVPVA
jgi:flagellar biogenesis protein FliO